VRWLLSVYAAGVLLALWRTDARLPARVAVALLWPVGPIAFMVTVSILLAASVVAFPAFGAAMLVAGGIAWWALS
jgi:hypothetical protein